MPLSSVVGAQSIIRPGVCTSSTRPASPYDGQVIYETDTDQMLVYDSTAWKFIGPQAEEISIFNETQASGTNGGTFTSGSWAKRTLNTTVVNNIAGCSLSSSVITLTAGTYQVQAYSQGFKVDLHQARLQNTTASITLATGTNAYAASANDVSNTSIIDTIFTLTGSTTIELQSRCSTTCSTNGLGPANTFGDQVFRSTTIRRMG